MNRGHVTVQSRLPRELLAAFWAAVGFLLVGVGTVSVTSKHVTLFERLAAVLADERPFVVHLPPMARDGVLAHEHHAAHIARKLLLLPVDQVKVILHVVLSVEALVALWARVRLEAREPCVFACNASRHKNFIVPSATLTLHSTKLCTKFNIFRKKKNFWY